MTRRRAQRPRTTRSSTTRGWAAAGALTLGLTGLTSPVAQASPGPVTTPGRAAALPLLSLTGGTAVEGDRQNSPATFMARLSRPAPTAVTFHFEAHSGTAVAGLDYIRHTREIRIPAGAVFAEIALDTVGDTLHEGNETFRGEISLVVGATLGTAKATQVILDDDPGADDALGVFDRATTEGDEGRVGLSFVFRLATPQTHPVTFRWATRAGTATAGSDFRTDGGTITIAAGHRKARVRVDVYADTVREGDETFTVEVSDLVGATPGKTVGTATVVDDD